MRKLEVFFDYACPFCLKGHEYLMELLHEYPDIEVAWVSCEAHPRPEVYGRYSDLCVQALLYVMDKCKDINLSDFHDRMYRATLKDSVDIENPAVLADYFKDLLAPDAFCAALESGVYTKAALDANDYAYEQSGVWFVPSYRMDGRKLDAAGGVGVTKKQLADFLKK